MSCLIKYYFGIPHNPKVIGSSPVPATFFKGNQKWLPFLFLGGNGHQVENAIKIILNYTNYEEQRLFYILNSYRKSVYFFLGNA